MKLKRWIGWWRVLKLEGRRITWRDGVKMFVGVMPWNRATRVQALGRYRECLRCPIFNRAMKSCRKGELGCGCYIPLLVRIKRVNGGCWIRHQDQVLVKKAFGRLFGWF